MGAEGPLNIVTISKNCGPKESQSRGARVALQQSPILRADENTILYLKELDTGQKLRHERKHLTHHHHWKKQLLLRIPAIYQ